MGGNGGSCAFRGRTRPIGEKDWSLDQDVTAIRAESAFGPEQRPRNGLSVGRRSRWYMGGVCAGICP